MNRYWKRFARDVIALVLWIGLVGTAMPAQADDRIHLVPLSQVTPSHVHAIWVEVNTLLIEFEEELDMDIRALKPNRYSEKAPPDVLVQVELIRRELNKLRLGEGLPAASLSMAGRGRDIQPRTVFLNSYLFLDALVEWADHRHPTHGHLGHHHDLRLVEGRTPSDVYAQVELAHRRLVRLTKQLGL